MLRLIRPLLFGVLVLGTVTWAISGRTLIEDMSARSPEETIQKAVQSLADVDPVLAADLKRLAESRDARELASVIRTKRDLSMLRAWVEQNKGATPYEVRLAQLVNETRIWHDDAELDAFLYSHATTCQILSGDTSGKALQHYLDLLEAAHQDTAVWPVVYDDPVGLVIWSVVRNQNDYTKLWSYYTREKNWLGPVLADVGATGDLGSGEEAPTRADHADALLLALRATERYHPLTKDMAVGLELDSLGAGLMVAYGPLIDRAVNDHKLPLDETLDVIFANADYFDGWDPNDQSTERALQRSADDLEYLYRNKKPVWEEARFSALVLRLNRDAPGHVSELIEKYGSDDIALMLYTYYEDAIPEAAKAIAVFGDLGMLLLVEYKVDRRMTMYLQDPSVGILVVPYVARDGDLGFDRIADDPDWVRKYFNEDGTPKEDKWYTKMPIVGAPADVIINLTNGYPLEWSEIGWAAVDVIDGALLVASFGGSSGLTAVKTMTKGGLKRVTKGEAARRAATPSRWGTGWLTPGSRMASRSGRMPILQRVKGSLRSKADYVLAFGRTGRNLVTTGANRTREAGQRLMNNWKSVNPRYRQYTYRSLLAVGLFITMEERTIPDLHKIGAGIGEFVGDLINGTAEAVGAALASALREVFLGDAHLSKGYIWLLYLLTMGMLVVLAYWMRPRMSRGVQRIA